MILMKKHILLSIGLATCVLWSPWIAAEPDPDRVRARYTYEFPIAGVVCGSCAATVKKAVEACPWAESAKVVKGGAGELPKLVIVANRPALAAAEVQAALGAHSSHYQVQSAAKAIRTP